MVAVDPILGKMKALVESMFKVELDHGLVCRSMMDILQVWQTLEMQLVQVTCIDEMIG